MLNRRRILAIILFIVAGLIVFTYANPSNNNSTDDSAQLEKLDNATTAVEKAEDSLLQTDVDAAWILVNKLDDGDDKDDLHSRLDAVQAQIDATKAVQKAETNGLQADVDEARGLVNDLPTGDVKTKLTARLDAIQTQIDAQKEKDRLALVAATTAPVITVLGDNPATVFIGSVYADAGAIATDNIDGTLTANIVKTGTVNTAVIGSYAITYTVKDSDNNVATATRTVYVVNTNDIVKPVITILGANPVTVLAGSDYDDAGATAIDARDGVLTSKIKTKDNVNTSILGTYTVVYEVIDAAGNKGTATRDVMVEPAVTFIPNGQATYQKDYEVKVTIDAGIGNDTAAKLDSKLSYLWSTSSVQPTLDDFINNSDGNFILGGNQDTYNVTIWSPALLNGTYYLWVLLENTDHVTKYYNMSMSFNIDNEAPVITLLGENPLYLVIGDDFSEFNEGATVIDKFDINVALEVDSTAVNTAVAGTYIVTYNATDASGNVATPVTRTVIVETELTKEKREAIANLNEYVLGLDEDDYSHDKWYHRDGIKDILDEAIRDINRADDTDDVNHIYEHAINDLKNVLTLVGEATRAVVKAEGSDLQVDVNAAWLLVNALADSDEKTDLHNRLDAIVIIGITLNLDGWNEYNHAHISVTNTGSGVDTTSLRYAFIISDIAVNTITAASFTDTVGGSFTINSSGNAEINESTANSKMSGYNRYRLCIYAKDLNNNERIVCSPNTFYED